MRKEWEADNPLVSLTQEYIDGWVQYCSNSSALAVELLQSYTKPSIYSKTPHQRPPRGRPPRLNGHFFWHRFIFFVNVM